MTGAHNFDLLERDIAKANILLQAYSYDGTSTWGKGADQGYGVFLEALQNVEFYDIESNTEPYKQGIATLPELTDFTSPDDMVSKVYQQTKQVLSMQKFPTFFGGEHSVSIGIMRAMREQYPNMTVLQIDAHSDLRPTYNDSQYNHACAMHEVSRHCNTVQVGIRSMDSSELEYMDQSRVYFAKDIHHHDSWMDEAISQLSDDVYLTFDLDALDPSIMPATGTPEPGGLQWYQTLKFLQKVIQSKNLVGFDIVEFAPIAGLHHPQNVVANLYYKILAYKYCDTN